MKKGKNETHEGKIIFYRDQSGWVFLQDSISQAEYFYHYKSLVADFVPTNGDKVSFVIGQGHKGPIAIEVQKIV